MSVVRGLLSSVVADDRHVSARAALCVGVALLALTCALLRLVTGPWYHAYAPVTVQLLDGFPADYEVTYYLAHLPTFLGDAAPQYSIAAVHYRAFASLYLSWMLYGWTGNAYWSLAAVDLAGWSLAGVASFFLARRLGAAAWPAGLGTLLLATSPLFISNMWMDVLHLAEFATLPLGLWAALALVEDDHDTVVLGALLGTLLLLLTLTYQYQWVLAPCLVILLAATRRFTLQRGAAVVGLAVAVYVAGTLVLRWLLSAIITPGAADIFENAVSQPEQLIVGQLAAARTVGALLGALHLLPNLLMTVDVFQPLVFVAGLAGLALAPARTRWLAAATFASGLLATTLYATPWTASTAFPFVYLGAGMACAAGGARLARAAWAGRAPGAPWARLPFTENQLGRGAGLLAALLLVALTNADLMGKYQFLLQWWSYYSGRILF